MEKNINLTSFTAFSYVISILLVYPFLKLLIHYYTLPTYYLFFMSIPSGFLVNKALLYINENYSFTNKILKSKFFSYYLLFSLKIENSVRKKESAFFFGILFSVLLIIFCIGLYNEISFKYIWLYSSYYNILIYIKVRNSLLNNEVLQLQENNYLKWHNFLDFYEIKKSRKSKKEKLFYFLDIDTNHEFKNITPLFILSNNPSVYGSFFQFVDIIKKMRFYVIKFLFGFFSTMLSYISYSHFISSIDGLNGIRSILLRKIHGLSDVIQSGINHAQSTSDLQQKNDSITVQNAVKQFKLDHIEELNNRLSVLEKLNEKISSLSLIYFVSKKNRDFLKQLYEVLKQFETSNSHRNTKLEMFLKKNHFLNFLDTENNSQACVSEI